MKAAELLLFDILPPATSALEALRKSCADDGRRVSATLVLSKPVAGLSYRTSGLVPDFMSCMGPSIFRPACRHRFALQTSS